MSLNYRQQHQLRPGRISGAAAWIAAAFNALPPRSAPGHATSGKGSR